MRARYSGGFLQVRAIAGSHVVTLAWDFLAGTEDRRMGLLGFAIERAELDEAGEVVEKYWLRGVKRFRFKDEGLPPGSPVPTSEHPVQSFQWADYTAKPGTSYGYRVVPAFGKPKLLSLAEDLSTCVEVRCESEIGRDEAAADSVVRHGVWFNRGVAGSQAYARKFGRQKPDQTQPLSEQMAWLSRGLFEALVAFIETASGEDAADYQLRAMLYEFKYAPVGEAFLRAKEAGADVDIRYEAKTYKEENEAMIEEVGIGDVCSPQKSRDGIRHNKFIVLVHLGTPVALWTGSTNISPGGIFGHSNVGHEIWDRDIAQLFMDYWEKLADPEVKPAALRASCQAATPTPADVRPPKGVSVLFSPRDSVDPKTSSQTLQWYADLIASAGSIACMTLAFNFDRVFSKAVEMDTDALTYLVFDKAPNNLQETQIRRNKNAVIAVGSKLEQGDLENFVGEALTGFNRNRYIHDKFFLVDPLSDDPIVVTGTANFSEPSQESNDENMVVIRGDTRIADIYFGEFMRVFDHHYVRYIVAKLKLDGQQDANAGYLKVSTGEWLDGHLKAGPKARRREAYMR
jgi:phosphatidylserine/phosphatidylglycerophosphate/cardiolipin synthase-like enzyme